MTRRIINITIGLAAGAVFLLIAVGLNSFGDRSPALARIGQIMGGDLPNGLVQFFTFWVFGFGAMELLQTRRQIQKEQRAYELKLLPEREQFILNPQDVNDIKLRTIKSEQKYGAFLLTGLIKRACTKYRSNKSTSETLEIITAQVRINSSIADSRLAMVRYVAWAIPSIGFIGTIIGIAGALGNVKSEMGGEDIELVTSALYVAFDTTLLSLFLSILLMFLFHVIQEQIEIFHNNMESYAIENLINRIYK